MILSKRKTNSKDHMVVRSLFKVGRIFTNREFYWDKDVLGYPGGTAVKKLAYQCRRCEFYPWVRKIPSNNLPPKAGPKRTLV